MLHDRFQNPRPFGSGEEDLYWTDDGWTPEHGYTISSPCEPNGSGELKSSVQANLYVLLYEP